jgi:hypothetical protein
MFGSGGADRVVAASNAIYVVFLALSLIAMVGVFRRMRPEYGAYVAISLLVAVSAPVAWQPLMSFGRLLAVVFPIPMWLATVLYRRRAATAAVYAASAALLVSATGAFATWHLLT